MSRFLTLVLVVLALVGFAVAPVSAQIRPLYEGGSMFGVPTAPVTAPRPGMVILPAPAPTQKPTLVGKIQMPYGIPVSPDTRIEFTPLMVDAWTGDERPMPERINVPTCMDERRLRRLNVQTGCIEPNGSYKLFARLEPNVDYRVWAVSNLGWDESAGGRTISTNDTTPASRIQMVEPGIKSGGAKAGWVNDSQVRARLTIDATQLYGRAIVKVTFTPQVASNTKISADMEQQIQYWYIGGSTTNVDFSFSPGVRQQYVQKAEVCGKFQVTYYDQFEPGDMSWGFVDVKTCVDNTSPWFEGYGGKG